MSVYKPKNSPYWHFDFQWQGARFHGSTGQVTKAAAQRLERRKREQVAGLQGKPQFTLDEACGAYWMRHGEKKRSARDIRRQIGSLLAGLGKDRYLSEITQADLAHHAARRRAKVADSTVNRELDLARAIWRWAGEHLDADTGRGIRWGKLRFREPQGRTRSLSADEEKRLFAALLADRPDFAPFLQFALLSGCRLSEVLTLRWADVDLQGRVAVIAGKGGKIAPIPLTAQMVALLANQPRACPQVFTYEAQRGSRKRRKGERYPIGLSTFRKAWGRALKAAKVDDLRVHDLRHTTATRLLRETGNMAAVQNLLRHADISTTKRYAHFDLADLARAMERTQSRNSPEAHHADHMKKRDGSGA